MVRTCFRDPRVKQAFRHSIFPVRVDADRRPDLAERYGMGGWPSVVFLSPGGEWITGSTFLDPDDLSSLIRRIRVFYDHPDRLEDLNRARRLLEERSDRRRRQRAQSVAELSQPLLGQVVDSIRAAAVRGEDPGAEGLELLLSVGEDTGDSTLMRDVQAALDRVVSGRLRDSDGGFFLAELTPDGAIVDREKHLLRNAGLLSVLTAAGQHTGQARFLDAAEGLAAFLLNRFYDETRSRFVAGFAGFVEQHGPGQPARVTSSFEKQTATPPRSLILRRVECLDGLGSASILPRGRGRPEPRGEPRRDEPASCPNDASRRRSDAFSRRFRNDPAVSRGSGPCGAGLARPLRRGRPT